MTYAVVSGLSLFIAIFCVPLLLLVLKTKTLRAGFLFSFVFTIAICFLLEMVIALLDGPEELTTFVAILVPSTSLAIWLPLAAIKIAGFRLTSPKRESANSRRNGTNAQTPPSQEKANDPVHPLDVQDETD